jgi:uncharacterized damage-inducible protein DinB
MDGARTLRDLYAHNAWANALVFEISRGVDRVALEENAPGTYGTLAETLTHLVSVEDAYLRMLRDESLAAMGPREEYHAHDMDWFAERSRELGRAYADLLASVDAAFFDQPLRVPWFDFPLTKHDGLLQVLTHSAQHRAQVFSVLGERGVKVPDLDYVVYIRRER